MPEGPKKIVPKGLADYLDVMSKSVFQTGMSWKVVEKKWPGIQEAFSGFDPRVIAHFTEDEIDRLVGDTRIIRNRRKVQATVHNARQMLEMEDEHGTFRDYLRSHGSFDATVADLKKRFKFLGEMGTFLFLNVAGEEVPSYEDWRASHGVKPAAG